MIRHEGFVTTGTRPFRHDSFPMRLFQKAKKFGTWDPYDLDFSKDKENYALVPEEFKPGLLGLLSVFQAGEESVTMDILPLIMAVAKEGRIEDEMYLTTFLFEEAKHVEFFNRWLREVADIDPTTLPQYHTPTYKKLFYEELPAAMWILSEDPSPRNQLRASITYNMIIEGVLAESGYFSFDRSMELLGGTFHPGLHAGIAKLRQDESRHIAYVIYLISRLLAQHPDLWEEAESTMDRLSGPAFQFVQELIDSQTDENGNLPLGELPETYLGYARGQYEKRLARLRKARNQSLDEVEQIAIDTETEAA